VETALATRDELIAELRRELAELREQADQPDQETATERDELQARLGEAAQAHEAEVARLTDVAAAHVATLEAEVETALAGRDELIAELQRELAELREQSEQPQDEHVDEQATGGRAHLLFLPSASGYALIDFAGPDPPSGTLLDVDGVSYVVRRIGVSPFPGSRLRCVFVEPV
jgi:FtsZ-binding cell division protein ZapB